MAFTKSQLQGVALKCIVYIYIICTYLYLQLNLELNLELRTYDYICIYVKLSTIAISNSLTRHVWRRATAAFRRWDPRLVGDLEGSPKNIGTFHPEIGYFSQSQGFTQPGYDMTNSLPWFFDGPNRNRWFTMVYHGLP